jgi:hypothetical protein
MPFQSKKRRLALVLDSSQNAPAVVSTLDRHLVRLPTTTPVGMGSFTVDELFEAIQKAPSTG